MEDEAMTEREKWQRYRALLVRYIEALRDRARELN